LKKPTQDAAVSTPPAGIDPDVDPRQLIVAWLRRVEDLVRTARTRIQGAYPAQGSEALDEVRHARAVLSQIEQQLKDLGVVDNNFLGSGR